MGSTRVSKTRLDNSTDNTFSTELASLWTDVNELKSRQNINRSLVRRSFITTSNSAFDVNGFTIAAGQTHFFEIVFTGDGSQPYPYGVQYSQVYNNGTDSAHRMSDYQLLDFSNSFYNWSADASVTGPHQIGWFIAVNAGPLGAVVYIKVRTMTTCAGSWSLSW